MTNPNSIPYSTEAIANLIALEREHKSYTFLSATGEALCNNIDCETLGLGLGDEYTIFYPCPTLIAARESASEETLVAVALLLMGEARE